MIYPRFNLYVNGSVVLSLLIISHIFCIFKIEANDTFFTLNVETHNITYTLQKFDYIYSIFSKRGN